MARRLALVMALAVVFGCTHPVTRDAVGPDAPLRPVDLTTTADTAMWGPLADCVATDKRVGPAPTERSAPEAIAGVMAFGREPGQEVEGCGRIGRVPPVGGDWNAQSANCGFYTSPVPVPPAVTALRRGAVWVVFRPDVSEDDLHTIRTAATHSGFILASPQAELQTPLVLTAWGRQLQLESTADPRFDDFIDTYTNAYRVPEINGSCRFGLGEPQDKYR